MQMKRLFILLAVAVCMHVSKAWTQDCPKQKLDEIAKEVVTAELLGASLSDPFKCLKEHKFAYIKPQWLPPNDGKRIFDVGVKLSSLKILKIEMIDEFSGQYRVDFEVKAEEKFDNKTYKDSMEVAVFPNQNDRERYGCGHTMSTPKKYFLADICYVDSEVPEQESKQ